MNYKVVTRFNHQLAFLNNYTVNSLFYRKYNTCLVKNNSSLLFKNDSKKLTIYFLKFDLSNSANTSKKINLNDKIKDEKEKEKGKKVQKAHSIKNLLRAKDLVDFIFLAFLGCGIYIGYKNYKEKKEINLKYDLQWMNVPKLKHRLFKCDNYYLPEFIAKNLSDIKNFKLRKEDVWVVSFPKSGTTWVQEIVYLILTDCNFEKAKESSIETRSPFIDFPSPGIKYINNLKSPRIIKTHMPYSFLPDNVQNESKVIYILRNPKDVCVSYYHFAKMSTEAEYTGDFQDFSQIFVEGIVPYGPWWKHVDDYTNKENIHIIHYEEIHENPKKVVEKLCKFLGKNLDENQIDFIIDWCSFDSMKKNPSVNYDWYKEIGLFRKDGSFFRKGKIGDWLNHFDYNMSKKFDEVIEKNLNYLKRNELNYGISNQDLKKIYEYKINTISNNLSHNKLNEK